MSPDRRRFGRIAAVGVGILLPIVTGSSLGDNPSPEAIARPPAIVVPVDGEIQNIIAYNPETVAKAPSIEATGIIEGVARSVQQDWLVFQPSPEFLALLDPVTNRPDDDPWTRLLVGFVEQEEFTPSLKDYINGNVGNTFRLSIPAIFDQQIIDTLSNDIPPHQSEEESLVMLGGTNVQRLIVREGYYTHIFAVSPRQLTIHGS